MATAGKQAKKSDHSDGHGALDGHGGHGDDDEEHHEEAHHEAAHEEPWLVSYADLMTLLFGFFVLMYTFAAAKLDEDPEKMIKLREEVARHFGGTFITPMKDDVVEFKKKLIDQQQLKEIETKVTPEGIEISFRSNLLFDLGDANLKENGKKTLTALSQLLQKAGKNAKIIVEGHTDDVPIGNTKKYSSNWELSGSRAAHVVEHLLITGLDPDKIRAEAYADTKPLAPNRDANRRPIDNNRARNRRVTIKVTDLDLDQSKKKRKAEASQASSASQQQKSGVGEESQPTHADTQPAEAIKDNSIPGPEVTPKEAPQKIPEKPAKNIR